MTNFPLYLGYVAGASLEKYNIEKPYELVSAKDISVVPDSDMLKTGVDIALMRLYIHNAPERKKWLGLRDDRGYEIMVTFSPVHLYGKGTGEVMKSSYSKFYNIEKEAVAGGFAYKKMFQNLRLRRSLKMDVSLTEIDNKIVDPEPLEDLLNDTGVGTLMDLAPYNPKEYLVLASKITSRIQDVFGVDKPGDDHLWEDALDLEPVPTIPGSYRLREGFYAIIEDRNEVNLHDIVYRHNTLYDSGTSDEIKTNYLIFSVGKSLIL